MPDLPSGWLTDTFALYGRVFRRGVELTARSWPMILGIAATLELVSFGTALLARSGMPGGGLLVTLLTAACVSAWLSFAAQVVRAGRVRPGDLASGFGTYLGDLLTVGFLLWGLQLIAALVLAPLPFLRIVFWLATIVFLNAVPELIYLGRYSAADLLVASYRFIGENWIEWFPASIALGALVVAATLMPPGPLGILVALTTAAALAVALVVRGLLFLELTTSGRRARAFHRRAVG